MKSFLILASLLFVFSCASQMPKWRVEQEVAKHDHMMEKKSHYRGIASEKKEHSDSAQCSKSSKAY